MPEKLYLAARVLFTKPSLAVDKKVTTALSAGDAAKLGLTAKSEPPEDTDTRNFK